MIYNFSQDFRSTACECLLHLIYNNDRKNNKILIMFRLRTARSGFPVARVRKTCIFLRHTAPVHLLSLFYERRHGL